MKTFPHKLITSLLKVVKKYNIFKKKEIFFLYKIKGQL